jgi:hypothetical protein
MQRQNAEEAKKVCVDVWGPNYATGGLECDEFPFQSTYEGAHRSSGGDWTRWHGSARPIPGNENLQGGLALQAFYGQNRILDDTEGAVQSVADGFWVHVTP